jgi:hypothetical protein
MIKKDPCACWLVCDTNFSGAGIWWLFGIDSVMDDSYIIAGGVHLSVFSFKASHYGLVSLVKVFISLLYVIKMGMFTEE